MKYRKKPVVIEAIQILAYTELMPPEAWNKQKGGRVFNWLIKNGAKHCIDFWSEQKDPGPVYLVIKTLEGNHKADIGDWIIKGVKGEFYPCKPDIFEMTYEAVDELTKS